MTHEDRKPSFQYAGLLRTHIRRYVEHYMPLEPLSRLLCLCSRLPPEDAFSLREFNLGFVKPDGSDGYSRFHQFSDVAALRKALLFKAPCRIDVGAIFAVQLDCRNLGIDWRELVAFEKELVFDIDINDYEDIRRCGCSGKTLCQDCWQLLGFAAWLVDLLMRRKFGCTDLLWVYSGRRGVHGWVLDQRAATFSPAFRKALAAYFSPFQQLGDCRLYTGNCRLVAGLFASHILPRFERLLESRALDLNSDAAKRYVFRNAQPEQRNAPLLHGLASAARPGMRNIEIWNSYKMALRNYHPQGEAVLQRIVLSLAFPRIDEKVSTDCKHLAKCPFSWHPRTGAICVPFDVQEAGKFEPLKAPNISEPTSFSQFAGYVELLEQHLLDALPLAEKYVCAACARSAVSLSFLPPNAVFDCIEAWQEHAGTHEQRPPPTQLRDLVAQFCSENPSENQNTLKRIYYTQLRDKFA